MDEVIFFKALADPTRIRICSVLLGRELSVNELVSLFGMGQSRISRHLKILTDCGILSCRRDGLWSFYSVSNTGDGRRFIDAVSYLFTRMASEQDLLLAEELLIARQAGTVRFFNNAVHDWERSRREILGSFNLDEEIVSQVAGFKSLADLGCGNGVLSYLLASHHHTVIGVDASPGMIALARKKIGDYPGKLDFRIGELEHLPFRDEECDAAVVVLTLHHLSSPQNGLAEVGRILRMGGRLVIADFEKHNNEAMRSQHHDLWLGFSEDELARWLSSTGFKIVSDDRIQLESGITLLLVSADK